jgi:Xaa-Pro aminopeptidase
MWPVDGTYSAVQRQLYGFVVAYHKVLLERIRPGRMMADIEAEAAEVMRGVLGRWTFSSPIYEAAARGMFEFRGHLSHCVGMCVHDGGGHWRKPLEPGIVFSVDPQMRVPEERLYIRVEDTVVVTADGIENLTRDTPLELDDVEAAMREPGLLQAFPPACP